MQPVDVNSDANNESINLEQLLQLGIQTARAGNRPSARLMFERVLAVNNNEERAWFWMASLAENADDKRRYLETVLKLNPGNDYAKRALDAMGNVRARSNAVTLRFGLFVLGILLAVLVVGGIVVYIITRS